MKKKNKPARSHSIEKLLVSLRLENETSFVEEIHSEYNGASSEKTACLGVHEESQSEDYSSDDEKCQVSEKLSFLPLQDEVTESSNTQDTDTMIFYKNFVVECGERYDYNFTEEDLEKYMIKRKKRIKITCQNWEDVCEKRINEPRKITIMRTKK